jgi:hypothetical protein
MRSGDSSVVLASNVTFMYNADDATSGRRETGRPFVRPTFEINAEANGLLLQARRHQSDRSDKNV